MSIETKIVNTKIYTNENAIFLYDDPFSFTIRSNLTVFDPNTEHRIGNRVNHDGTF